MEYFPVRARRGLSVVTIHNVLLYAAGSQKSATQNGGRLDPASFVGLSRNKVTNKNTMPESPKRLTPTTIRGSPVTANSRIASGEYQRRTIRALSKLPAVPRPNATTNTLARSTGSFGYRPAIYVAGT